MVPHMRLGPGDENLSHHPEEILSIRVGTCQPSGPDLQQQKEGKVIRT